MNSLLNEKTKNDFIEFGNEKFNESFNFYFGNIDKEEEKDLNMILKELNKAIQINLDCKYLKKSINNECKELIFLLENKGNKKINHSNKMNKSGPFKPLKKPKIISMTGRVLSNTSISSK